MNIKIILLLIFIIYCTNENKKIENLTNTKENFYDYVTFIPYNNMFIILGRYHRKRDYIKGFIVDQKFKGKEELKIFINNKKSNKINTSIVHNFTATIVGQNKFIANAGRDPWSDIHYYDKGHDKGMYFFTGSIKKNSLYFKENGLKITRKTGATQLHPASNECFTPIFYFDNKYYIYCRYNIRRGERLSQVLVSKNGIDNWDLEGIVYLTNNKNKMLSNYSIYMMNIGKLGDKIYSLIRYSKGKLNKETDDKSYKLYLFESDNGLDFKVVKLIKSGNFWPCYGYVIKNNCLHFFILERYKNLISELIIDKNQSIKMNWNILKL